MNAMSVAKGLTLPTRTTVPRTDTSLPGQGKESAPTWVYLVTRQAIASKRATDCRSNFKKTMLTTFKWISLIFKYACDKYTS